MPKTPQEVQKENREFNRRLGFVKNSLFDVLGRFSTSAEDASDSCKVFQSILEQEAMRAYGSQRVDSFDLTDNIGGFKEEADRKIYSELAKLFQDETVREATTHLKGIVKMVEGVKRQDYLKKQVKDLDMGFQEPRTTNLNEIRLILAKQEAEAKIKEQQLKDKAEKHDGA